MNEVTILTERIIDTYLLKDKLIVITNPNNKIWFCKKMSKIQFEKFCDNLKENKTVTLKLKGKGE